MNFEERTLDLTCFNRANFAGVIRLRQIADWANDYYANGYKLAKIKLFSDEYRALFREIEEDNRLVRSTPFKTLSINFGFGEVEIIEVKSK